MKKHIVFTGGGTGGHVYPAIAILDILREEGFKVSWIGSRKGIEYTIVKKHNVDFYSIPCGKLRRYFSILNLIDLFKITGGLFKSFFILLKLKPDLIFSKGGYVTVPPVVVSKILGIKSVTHESDFDPGLATKINSRFVDRIFIPYHESKKYFSENLKRKLVVTGNPVRSTFFNKDGNNEIKKCFTYDKPLIVVIGGSLGAQDINRAFLNDKDKLTKDFNIYHQMGEKNYIKISEESYITVPYIYDIDKVLKNADIVVSRSGAGSIWEFITVGLPMILIPLVSGSRGDQVKNAKYFQDKGAAIIFKNSELKSKSIADFIGGIHKDELIRLRKSSELLGKDNASTKIVEIIKELL